MVLDFLREDSSTSEIILAKVLSLATLSVLINSDPAILRVEE